MIFLWILKLMKLKTVDESKKVWKYAQKCQIRPEMVKNAQKQPNIKNLIINGFLGSKKVYNPRFFFVDSEADQTEICS